MAPPKKIEEDEVPTNPIPQSTSFGEAAAAVKGGGDDTKKGPDPKVNETYSFTVNVYGGDGKLVEGSGAFTNRILTIQERVDLGLAASKIVRHLPWQVLDPDTQETVLIGAHLTLSLSERPDKFDVSKIRNPRLLSRVWQEVEAHEATFRGSEPPEGAGPTRS